MAISIETLESRTFFSATPTQLADLQRIATDRTKLAADISNRTQFVSAAAVQLASIRAGDNATIKLALAELHLDQVKHVSTAAALVAYHSAVRGLAYDVLAWTQDCSAALKADNAQIHTDQLQLGTDLRQYAKDRAAGV